MTAFEVNFDGIAGPTHNYAGLAYGNLASLNNAYMMSNPKAAVQQSLVKMAQLLGYGLKQAIIPPQARPNIPLLHRLGFTGSHEQMLKAAYAAHPKLLAASYSSSSMWTANAATVSPSIDTADHKVHFTAANLMSQLHRHQEAASTYQLLKSIFKDERSFTHHAVLPSCSQIADEGAANHTRFTQHHGQAGVELFVFDRFGFDGDKHLQTILFPARQTYEASVTVARLHGLDMNQVVFAQQNPVVIDEGVFHNDVISVGNQNTFLYHEHAFINTREVITELQQKAKFELHLIEVPKESVSVQDAVRSYLFNSQLLTIAPQEMLLFAPLECQQLPSVKAFLEQLIATDPYIRKVEYIDCRQSMRNGGGPACLRLRVVLTETEIQNIHQGVLVTPKLLQDLNAWSEIHYRDRLTLEDLLDPKLIEESNRALDELSQLFGLGSIYYFQR